MKNSNVVQLDKLARDKFNLDSQTVTTARVCSNHPVCVYEVLPGDKFNVNMEQLNRIDSLPVSAFASFKNRLAGFYVKYSQIWKPYDSYKTGAPYAFGYINSRPTEKPYLSMFDLFRLFSYNNPELVSSQVLQPPFSPVTLIESHEYDFIRVFLDGSTLKAYGFKLTGRGRSFYKVLYALGFRIPQIVDSATEGSDYAPSMYSSIHQSILPLMAYLSIMVNYYHPLKWRSFEFVNSMSYLVDPVPQHFLDFTAPSAEMLNWWRSVVYLCTYVYYGSDYFTDALVDPFASAHGESLETISDPLNPNIVAHSGYQVQPKMQDPTTDGNAVFTQYIVYALSVITGQAQISALTLNDINKAALAKFGYKAECADMVPFLLNKVDDKIVVIPEMSMADTLQGEGDNQVGAPIGYKAGSGKGYSKFTGRFHFDTYGEFIVINSVMPDYFYPYGIRRPLLRTKIDDEFDRNKAHLGYQAVARAELDVRLSSLRGTFGFTRMYYDYCRGNDILGGDFCINTVNNGLDIFHLARRVLPETDNNELFSVASDGTHIREESHEFSYADGIQFNRVFVDAKTDPIQQWYLIKIKASRPVSGDISIGEHDGEKVELAPVGSVVNA